MNPTASDHSAPGLVLPAFLGVEKSVTGAKWLERLAPGHVNEALAIAQHTGCPEIVSRILAARQVSATQAEQFLNPGLRTLLPDPASLQDMNKAATRIADAILKQQNIGILGDYDVDGATSSALLQRFFAAHNVPVDIHIPDRLTEGYGPNVPALAGLVERGARLVLTVDCGTTALPIFQQAKEQLGEQFGEQPADFIIIDHHQADPELPDVLAVVNPNRQDDLSGQGHLAAVGVTFLVLVAVTRLLRQQGAYSRHDLSEPDLLSLLDLVALGTACDLVPLTGVNRAFIRKGLAVMRYRQNPGVRALTDRSGLQVPPDMYHLGFVLGPRINAGGRIGDSQLGVRLLTTTDDNEAAALADRLHELNARRQAMEADILEEALAQAQHKLEQDPALPLIMLGSPDWHKGLVGLIASRIVERFKRPAAVISWHGTGKSENANDEGTASLRSVRGIDIGAAIRAAVEAGHLVKGGGHAMAGGLTLRRDRLAAAEAFLYEHLRQHAPTGEAARQIVKIDAALTPRGASPELARQLNQAGPFGPGNPAPRLVLPSVHLTYARIVGKGHVRCTLKSADNSRIDAIAFRAADTPIGEALLGNIGASFHVAGKLKLNEWGGTTKAEFVIDDLAFASRSKKSGY